MTNDLRERLAAAVASGLCPHCDEYSVPSELREALAALDAKDAEIGRLRDALEEARSGLQIAAGWARTKPDSENARAKIRSGLDAIRSALRNNPRQALEPKP
jgi:hypothetical protein